MGSFKRDHDFSKIKNMPIERRAYLAGMIDADGTITASSKKLKDGGLAAPDVIVLLVNTNFDLIEWVKETVGYGCAYFTKSKPVREDQDQRNWRPVHRYQVTGQAARELLAVILPYLIVKVENANLCLSLPKRGVNYTYRASPEQIKEGYAIVQKIRQNNRRGVDAEGPITL